jgi:transposase
MAPFIGPSMTQGAVRPSARGKEGHGHPVAVWHAGEPLPPKCPELNPVENVWQFNP